MPLAKKPLTDYKATGSAEIGGNKKMGTKGSVPKTMKALVAYGKGDYRFEPEYPTPECGPDDIIIKTEACGICAGDLKCQHGAAMFWGDETQPSWVKPPFIPGHEFFGRVVMTGENVEEYQLGDRIIADQIVPCGKCRFCKDGHYWMCQPHDMLGFMSYTNGGMAEYFAHPADMLWKIPEDMPWELAPISEPLTIALHGIHRGGLKAGEHVAIIGAGPIGVLAAMAAIAYGATPIMIDVVDERLEFAKKQGVRYTINSVKENTQEKVKEYTSS